MIAPHVPPRVWLPNALATAEASASLPTVAVHAGLDAFFVVGFCVRLGFLAVGAVVTAANDDDETDPGCARSTGGKPAVSTAAASAIRFTKFIDTPAEFEIRTSDLEDLLAVERVQDSAEHQHERHRKGQRRYRRQPRRERYLIIAVSSGTDLPGTSPRAPNSHPRDHGGSDERHHRIHAVYDERLRPSLQAIHVDDPQSSRAKRRPYRQ